MPATTSLNGDSTARCPDRRTGHDIQRSAGQRFVPVHPAASARAKWYDATSMGAGDDTLVVRLAPTSLTTEQFNVQQNFHAGQTFAFSYHEPHGHRDRAHRAHHRPVPHAVNVSGRSGRPAARGGSVRLRLAALACGIDVGLGVVYGRPAILPLFGHTATTAASAGFCRCWRVLLPRASAAGGLRDAHSVPSG